MQKNKKLRQGRQVLSVHCEETWWVEPGAETPGERGMLVLCGAPPTRSSPRTTRVGGILCLTCRRKGSGVARLWMVVREGAVVGLWTSASTEAVTSVSGSCLNSLSTVLGAFAL